MNCYITEDNFIPGYTVIEDGGTVWARDYGSIIVPTWKINRFIDSLTHDFDNKINAHIQKVVAMLDREATKRGYNAILCLNVEVNPIGEFGTMLSYEIYAEGVMCVIDNDY